MPNFRDYRYDGFLGEVNRTKRLYHILIFTPFGLGLLLYFMPATIYFFLSRTLGIGENIFFPVSLGFFAISISVWLLRYLQYGVGLPSLPKLSDYSSAPISDHEKLVTKSQSDLIAEPDLAVSTIAKASVMIGQAKLDGARNTEVRILPLSTKANISSAEASMSEPRKRLCMEVGKLGFRNNVNLVFGVITAASGLWLLSHPVFNAPIELENLAKFAATYLPRLTLVIFIEIFAYFFLGLYKKGLSEIKYFQNEITNLEAKEIALDAALNTKNDKLISEVIGKISETERNHILNKGQTTVEIEIAKNERAAITQSVKSLAAIVKTLTGKDVDKI